MVFQGVGLEGIEDQFALLHVLKDLGVELLGRFEGGLRGEVERGRMDCRSGAREKEKGLEFDPLKFGE